MISRDSKNLPPYKLTPQYLSRGGSFARSGALWPMKMMVAWRFWHDSIALFRFVYSLYAK